MMKKLLASIVLVGGISVGATGVANAEPSHQGCRGLDVAHEQVHESATGGELRLHTLRSHGGDAWQHHC